MELWPEMTGQYSRSSSELLAQVPSQYHRVTRLLFTGLGKEQHDLNGILPTVQCFDGSVRMTLLNNNCSLPDGCLERPWCKPRVLTISRTAKS